jgi:hypothetical protein
MLADWPDTGPTGKHPDNHYIAKRRMKRPEKYSQG